MQAGPETKKESLTSVVGAAEIRQTAEGIESINHGPEPIEVRLSARCTSHPGSEPAERGKEEQACRRRWYGLRGRTSG